MQSPYGPPHAVIPRSLRAADFPLPDHPYPRVHGRKWGQCDRAPKSSLVGSPRRCPKRGPRQATNSWSTQPAWSRRGQRTWRMITRVRRELGRPWRLHRHCRPEPPAYQLRVDPQPSPGLMGTNKGHTDGIAKRRQRSAARRASGSRSAPIVVPKRGNGPSRTPWSEGGNASRTGGRDHAEGIVPPSVSPPSRGIVRGTANPRREDPDASSTRTSGSVGDLGGRPPRSTRLALGATVIGLLSDNCRKALCPRFPYVRVSPHIPIPPPFFRTVPFSPLGGVAPAVPGFTPNRFNTF